MCHGIRPYISSAIRFRARHKARASSLTAARRLASLASDTYPLPYRRGDGTALGRVLVAVLSGDKKPCGTCREHRAGRGAMCKIKLNKERVGCFLLAIVLVVLLIGVLFGLGVFRHGYDRVRDLGRNHTCYDCNTG